MTMIFPANANVPATFLTVAQALAAGLLSADAQVSSVAAYGAQPALSFPNLPNSTINNLMATSQLLGSTPVSSVTFNNQYGGQ